MAPAETVWLRMVCGLPSQMTAPSRCLMQRGSARASQQQAGAPWQGALTRVALPPVTASTQSS